MSWSSDGRGMFSALVRCLGVLLCLILPSCGFAPVYGPNGAAQGLYGDIDVAAPRDVSGFLLVEQLERRLGLPNGASRYNLTADIRLEEVGLGITPDQEITRIRLRGQSNYTLTDTASGRIAALRAACRTSRPIRPRSSARIATPSPVTR